MAAALRVGVASGTPPPKVMRVLTEVVGRHGLVCKEPAPFAVFANFGERALVFALSFWLEPPGSSNPMVITSDLRLMIAKRFAETGCGAPFPQRDIHVTAAEPLPVQSIDKPPAPAAGRPPDRAE